MSEPTDEPFQGERDPRMGTRPEDRSDPAMGRPAEPHPESLPNAAEDDGDFAEEHSSTTTEKRRPRD